MEKRVLKGQFEGRAVGHIIDATDDVYKSSKIRLSSLAPSVRNQPFQQERPLSEFLHKRESLRNASVLEIAVNTCRLRAWRPTVAGYCALGAGAHH